MSDWELSAPTQAQLATVMRALVANARDKIGQIGRDGFLVDGFLNNGTRFSINYYKDKLLLTGNMVQGSIAGYMATETVQVSGVFAIVRWLHPLGNSPPQPSQASGVTLIPLPSDSPIVFADD